MFDHPVQFLVESTLCLLVFYGFYHFILRKETFFQINRLYLLLMPLLSVLIPLFQFRWSHAAPEAVPDAQLLWLMLQQARYLEDSVWGVQPEPRAFPLAIGDVLVGVYLLGVLLMSIRFLRVTRNLIRTIRRSRKRRLGNMHLLDAPDHWPASFFGFVFWQRRLPLQKDQKTLILEHEKVHVEQWHSLDNVVMEFMVILKWFNPLIYLYRHSLQLTHEYLADRSVLRNRQRQVLTYAALIASLQTGRQAPSLVAPFFSHTKKRLQMITRPRSKKIHLIKYLSILPIFLALLMLFSFDLVEELPAGIPEGLLEVETLLETVSEKPLLPAAGPQSAPSDTVPVRIGTPKVQKPLIVLDGQVQEAGQEALESRLELSLIDRVNVLKGESALQKYGEAGRHGVIEIFTKKEPREERPAAPRPDADTLRLGFRIDADSLSKAKLLSFELIDGELQEFRIDADTLSKAKPLYILDGQALSAEEAERLDQLASPEDIRSINVWKGEQAVKKFGDAGKQGVVEIVTRNAPRKQEAETKKGSSEAPRIVIGSERFIADPRPLFVVDGKKLEQDQGERLDLYVDPNDIESINVLKGKAATEKYGAEGEQGVVEIKLKRGRKRTAKLLDAPQPDFQLEVAPTPSQDVAQVQFRLAGNEDRVELGLYDLSGKLLKTLYLGSLPAGLHKFSVNRQMAGSAGTFFLHLNVGGQVQTGKVIFN